MASKTVKTTLTLASASLDQALKSDDPALKMHLMNEAMALSLLSIAESLNRTAVQAGAAASSESDSG